MNRQLPDVLRREFELIADEPAPTHLAAVAIRQAHRRARVRTAVTGTVAFLLVLLLVPVLIAVRGEDRHTARPTPSPKAPPRSAVIDAYSGFGTGGPDQTGHSVLLNHATGGYEQVPYPIAVPSPDGSRVLIGKAASGTRLRLGILDRATGQVRWMNRTHRSGQWSSDGRSILTTTFAGEGKPGFTIIDAGTLAETVVEVAEFGTGNVLLLNAVWVPGGDRIALTASFNTDEAHDPKVLGVRFFDRTGKLVRTLATTAPLRRGAEFSRDGSRLALTALDGRSVLVIDVATGRVERTVQLPERAGVIGWHDDEHLVVGPMSGSDAGSRDELRVVDLAGRTVRAFPLPGGVPDAMPTGVEIHLGSADLLSGIAARPDLAF